MTEVWPTVPSAMCEVPAEEPGAGAAEVWKVTPRHHRFTPGGPTSVSSTAAVAAVCSLGPRVAYCLTQCSSRVLFNTFIKGHVRKSEKGEREK